MTHERLAPSWRHPYRQHLNQLKKHMERAAQTYFDHAVVVDFGCGDKPYWPLFEPRAAHCIGVDLPGNAHADLWAGADSTLPLANGCADMVLSTQVLEHVADPAHYLDEACRVLKPGGLLILSTHGCWIYHPHPADFWRWTSAGLRKIVTEHGFEIVEFTGVMGAAAAGLQLFQDSALAQLPRIPWLTTLATWGMQTLIGVVDRLSRAEYRQHDAGVYFVVARK